MSSNQSDPAALQRQAVEWFNLKRSGDMTRYDAGRLSEWLASSEEARRAYERLERHWEVFGAVANESTILAARKADARAYARSSPALKAALALAAALLLVVSSTTVYQMGLFDQIGSSAGGGETLTTGTGQRMTTVLADGSVITLDAESELRVLEMASRRRLELVHGHAFFRVAKDASRPFLVLAADKTVHAIGTEFDVRVEHSAVTVTLVEGKVRVDQPGHLFGSGHSAEMVEGGQLVVDRNQSWKLAQVDPQQETSWLSGRLTFFHDPLSTAVEEVNRYSTKKIVFINGKVPDTQIVGVFRAGDIDGFVTAIELNGIAHVVSRSDDRIELSAS